MLLASTVLVVAVHLVSDLDPTSRRLSEYVNGPAGYLMTAAFLALGLGLIALGLAMARTGGGMRSAVVSIAVAAAGVSVMVAGVFQTEPGATTTSEIVHSRASGGATLVLIGAALVWSFRPGAEARFRVLAVATAALGVMSALLHGTAATGFSQRLLWLALLGWLLLAALRLEHPVSSAVQGTS
jgi:Protein of unknown function (DUF998)